MSIYSSKIKIPYYHVDKNKKATPVAILKYLNEVSANHNDITMDADKIEKKGYGWMLNTWKIQIDRYPDVYEEIEIETWISKIKRFFVNREFRILDKNQRIIAYGTAQWIFMDMDRRRPTRLGKEFLDKNIIREEAYFTEFTRFPRELNLEKINTYKIRRLDIDMNDHVNNVNYFIWMLEAVEDDIYEKYDLKQFEIDYKSEVTYPSKISTWKRNAIKDNDLEIIHGIYNEDNGENNTLGRTIWTKK